MNPLNAMVLNNVILEDYKQGSQYYIDNFLKNNLGMKNKNQVFFGHHSSNGVLIDKKTQYKTNNFGFRDEDWNGPVDVLAIGCSNTYGIGVPVEGTWPRILQDLLGQKVRNLSSPGISIQELIFNAFAYFKEFGNPKTILCLFPDPFRVKLPTKENLVVGDISFPFINIHLNKKSNTSISDMPKYLKRPYDYYDTLPMEFSLFLNTALIHMLEQYCNSNNIKLLWSSWYSEFYDVVDRVEDSGFNNFLRNKDFIADQEGNNNCHNKYKDLPDEYFNRGLDGNDFFDSHPGVHKNIHIAEAFYSEIIK
jgi:hypothetical protein